LVDEGQRLLGPGLADQLIFLGEAERLRPVDPPGEIFGGDGEAGAGEVLQRLLERQIVAGAGGGEAGQWIERLRLERQPLVAGESEVDAVIGRAFGDEALRRVKRIDGELDPAPAPGELLLEQ